MYYGGDGQAMTPTRLKGELPIFFHGLLQENYHDDDDERAPEVILVPRKRFTDQELKDGLTAKSADEAFEVAAMGLLRSEQSVVAQWRLCKVGFMEELMTFRYRHKESNTLGIAYLKYPQVVDFQLLLDVPATKAVYSRTAPPVVTREKWWHELYLTLGQDEKYGRKMLFTEYRSGYPPVGMMFYPQCLYVREDDLNAHLGAMPVKPEESLLVAAKSTPSDGKPSAITPDEGLTEVIPGGGDAVVAD